MCCCTFRCVVPVVTWHGLGGQTKQRVLYLKCRAGARHKCVDEACKALARMESASNGAPLACEGVVCKLRVWRRSEVEHRGRRIRVYPD